MSTLSVQVGERDEQVDRDELHPQEPMRGGVGGDVVHVDDREG